MMYRWVIAILLLTGFWSPTALAQESASHPFRIKSKAHYGFILPHRTGMKNLIKKHVRGFEINYEQPTYGDKPWHLIYNYPTWGFSFFFADMGNPQEIGIAAGIYPYANFHFIKRKYFQLNYRVGWGLGYMGKKFHRVDNYKNIVIGSHINGIVGMHLETEWQLSKRTRVCSGIALTHQSNGSVVMPNLGFNILSVNAGLSYQFGDQETQVDSLLKLQRSWTVMLFGAGGIKEIYPPGRGKFGAMTIGGDFARTISRKSRVGLGLDVFYNASLITRLEADSVILGSNLAILQPGVNISYQASVHRTLIIVAYGAYLYTRYKQDGMFYHRIGMRYRLSEHLYGNIILKTHFFRADYIECGLAYQLYGK